VRRVSSRILPRWLGPNESRTRGIGPQIGYNFNVNGAQVCTNLRAYWEFDSDRGLQAHAVSTTVSIPLSECFASKAHSQ
jgi:hypothetical protein